MKLLQKSSPSLLSEEAYAEGKAQERSNFSSASKRGLQIGVPIRSPRYWEAQHEPVIEICIKPLSGFLDESAEQAA